MMAYVDEAYKNLAARKEILGITFDRLNAEDRFMKNRAQLLLGLTPYAAITSKKPPAPNYGENANRAAKEAQWAVRGALPLDIHLSLKSKTVGRNDNNREIKSKGSVQKRELGAEVEQD